MKVTKKKYERPKMEVVEVRQHAQLLAGSNANANVQDYDLESEADW